jgi:hypothetical protein
VFRSVAAELVSFVVRGFSTNSRPALRRPSSRRQRHDGHRGTGLTLAIPGSQTGTKIPSGPQRGREPSESSGQQGTTTVNNPPGERAPVHLWLRLPTGRVMRRTTLATVKLPIEPPRVYRRLGCLSPSMLPGVSLLQ